MVQNAIDTLKCGKSCGNDGLSAEHFKHADGCVTILLSIFYTGAIRHGYLPGDFMKTIIIPSLCWIYALSMVSKMTSYIILQNHLVWLSNHPDFN